MVKRKSEDETVDVVQWEFSGKKVAVGWSDGSLEVVSVETGKRLRLEDSVGQRGGSDCEEGTNRFTCIGWGLNFIDAESVRKRLGGVVPLTRPDTPATIQAKVPIWRRPPGAMRGRVGALTTRRPAAGWSG